jgi:hypothetical protein
MIPMLSKYKKVLGGLGAVLVEYPLIVGTVAYFGTTPTAVATLLMLPLSGAFAAKHWNDAFGTQASLATVRLVRRVPKVPSTQYRMNLAD